MRTVFPGLGLAPALALSLAAGVLHAADVSPSLTIQTLAQTPPGERAAAVEAFWKRVGEAGAPLVETIPGDTRHQLGEAADPPAPLLIGLSANSFRYAMPTDRMVDNLVAEKKIAAPLVVVAEDGGRKSEAEGYRPTAQFVAGELLPWLRARYRVTEDPAQVVIAGTSRRGAVGSILALLRPKAVGNVLAMSGSFYWKPPDETEYEWIPRQYAASSKLPVRFYLAAGRLETVVTPNNKGHYLVATNRHMRNVLRARGYDLRYVEYGGVHHELNWQGVLAEGLIHLLGTAAPS